MSERENAIDDRRHSVCLSRVLSVENAEKVVEAVSGEDDRELERHALSVALQNTVDRPNQTWKRPKYTWRLSSDARVQVRVKIFGERERDAGDAAAPAAPALAARVGASAQLETGRNLEYSVGF